MSDQAPLTRTLTADLDAAGTAGGQVQVVGEAPFDGEITAVSFTPAAAIVGHASNYRTLTLIDTGASGSGTAQAAAKAFNVASTAAANDELALTIDEARNSVSEGDILELAQTVAGGGLAHGGGLLQVEITRS